MPKPVVELSPMKVPSRIVLDALLSASIATFEIPMQDEWRIEALSFLNAIAEAAHLVGIFELGDYSEPAAVVQP
jgi:hypothetical protein